MGVGPTPAHRRNDQCLAIDYYYDETAPVPKKGDRVEITADRKVRPITQIGSPYEIGEVVAVVTRMKYCTVQTKFLRNRIDRIAGEAVGIGPFTMGPLNKVHGVTVATPARHDGTAADPADITTDSNDKVSIKVNGTSYVTTLTQATGRTQAEMAAEINAVVAAAPVAVEIDGHSNLVALQNGITVEVETIANDAYTALGWTAGIYYPTNASHDPAAIDGLVIVGGDADATVETLEW